MTTDRKLSTLKKEENKMVEIIYREQSEVAELAGKSVAEVREQYKTEFGIPDRAQAKLNGKTLKRKLEADMRLCDDDELSFAQKGRRGLFVIGATLLAMAITGGIFAYGATTTTIGLAVTDYGDFAAVTAAGTPLTFSAWGSYKGRIPAGDLFTVTPEANLTNADFSILVTIANAQDLVECYRILVMEGEVTDNLANTIAGPEYLSLGRGEIDFDVDWDADTPYTVEVTAGYYITHKGGWTTGREDPTLMCQVLQRNAP
jgi:hypothetical protein